MMRAAPSLLALLVLCLAGACAQPEPRTATAAVAVAGAPRLEQQICDDGGDGGVVIDGICL